MNFPVLIVFANFCDFCKNLKSEVKKMHCHWEVYQNPQRSFQAMLQSWKTVWSPGQKGRGLKIIRRSLAN